MEKPPGGGETVSGGSILFDTVYVVHTIGFRLGLACLLLRLRWLFLLFFSWRGLLLGLGFRLGYGLGLGLGLALHGLCVFILIEDDG